MLNLSEIIIHKIYELHSNGFSNRKIAKQLNINHKTVSSYLNKKNLVSNISPRQKSKYINNNLIECSKCKIVTFEHNFLICRRGKINQYRLSYCNQCRNKQLLKNINSNKFKILKDIFYRLKRRALIKNIAFDLDYNYLKEIFEIQNGLCFYSHLPMDLIRGVGSNWQSLTVDKVIPERGYTKRNIVLCTKKFNTVKNDLSLEEIKTHMPFWYNKLINTDWLSLGDFK